MNMKLPKVLAGALLVLALCVFSVTPALAVPLMPLLFTGNVTIGGNPAPVPTTISAEIDDIEVASVATSVVGHYAIPVPAEGNIGKMVVFKVNGVVGGQHEYVDPWTTPSVTLNLAIAGVPDIPDISVSPPSKNFGNVTVDSSSSPQTFTVSNDGTANLVIGTVTLTGTNANQFSKQNDLCSGQTIAPGSSKTLKVVFSPTSTGSKSATLNIPSNDPDQPTVTVSLSGSGVSATPTPPASTSSVGGTAYPPDKLAILWPWIGLAVLLAGGITWLVLRRRRAY